MAAKKPESVQYCVELRTCSDRDNIFRTGKSATKMLFTLYKMVIAQKSLQFLKKSGILNNHLDKSYQNGCINWCPYKALFINSWSLHSLP